MRDLDFEVFVCWSDKSWTDGEHFTFTDRFLESAGLEGVRRECKERFMKAHAKKQKKVSYEIPYPVHVGIAHIGAVDCEAEIAN